MVQPRGGDIPRAVELRGGGGTEVGCTRGGGCFGADEPAYDGADGWVRVLVWEVGVEMEGWDWRRGGAAVEIGGAQLHWDLFGVVVV